MRFSFSSGVRNDLLQEIANSTDTLEALNVFPYGILNPIVIAKSVLNSYIPHASTTRQTYTVPANKRAILIAIDLGIERTVAATNAGVYAFTTRFTPNGGASQIMMTLAGGVITLGAHQEKTQYFNLPLVTGDNIIFQTSDGSTNGTVLFSGAITIYEYDT